MGNEDLSVVLAGGGTAGHIEPALAVGEALSQHYGVRISALGTPKGLEGKIIPERGVDLHMIEPVPIPRKVCVDLFKLPVRIVRAVRQTRRILKEAAADAVFGTGGYVAAPAYIAAKTLGIPFFVLETNALAGMANKLGVKLGGIGFNAAEGSGMPGRVVGTPVRPGLGEDPDGVAAARGRTQWEISGDRPVLLITGGSQGAVSINNAVAGALTDLLETVDILHAVGPRNELPAAREGYVPVPYINDMQAALAMADLVVCRSGAMTVSEVSAAGLPAIYVPLPHGNGEQALNSRKAVAEKAAVRIDDADLTPQRLLQEVSEIATDNAKRAEMAAAARSTSGVGVAERIAGDIVKHVQRSE
ncbi:MAG: undecaprenyldiphospho-muramoylpentapeptide beta-N-acetylglucosaminyltransferase [Corynebacterium sp.]|nr:undecaprenyldiphospho-muramoylpentapeptide beta-N-acetylglucosaminyltransferase [Corynebacterium sp.]